jgi:UDP-N-acetylmuramoylalanine--D-glutamate ligase
MKILDLISTQSKVLILGFAREGKSTYHYLKTNFPALQIDIADQKHPDEFHPEPPTVTYFGKKYLSHLTEYKVIIKSPGISPHLPEIVKAHKSGTLFTSHMQIFFEICPSKNIIGVTGTKGKSTTTSLLHHVLTHNTLKSVLVGNIGKPALDYLPEIDFSTWVVCELSSYQLQDLQISPHIAILQNIYPDHLDYHKTFREYVEAKSHITLFQSSQDFFLYNADNPECLKIAKASPANKIPIHIPSPHIPSPLIGKHNQYNIMPSIIVGQLLHLSPEGVLDAIGSFTPLETRLQPITTKNDIHFYADTLATIPEATIAAIDSLQPSTLIAGGHERYQKYSALAKKILQSKIATLILFPTTGPRLLESVKMAQSLYLEFPLPQAFIVNSMTDAVNLAFKHTPSNQVCLLSPAAPSFTLFKDYKDEYNQYIKAISSYPNP